MSMPSALILGEMFADV